MNNWFSIADYMFPTSFRCYSIEEALKLYKIDINELRLMHRMNIGDKLEFNTCIVKREE